MTQTLPESFVPAFSGPPPSAADVTSGIGTQQTLSSIDEILGSLPELRWKDVSFPFSRLRTRLRHDLVVHKFVDRDGAHVEAVGRHPLEITARVPCLVGLLRGANETWQKPLYPYTRDKILSACVDKRAGTLQHPEIGALNCKCETMEWELDAQVRSGVWVDLVWIESDDTSQQLTQDLAAPSPLANLAAAAADLDSQLAQFPANNLPQPYEPPYSFDDLMQSIRAVADQTTLLQKQFEGRLDNVVYQATALEDSLARASNSLNWPLIEAAEKAKSAAYDLRAVQLTKARKMGLYVVPKDSTMGQIATNLGANISDIMVLNTQYLSTPIVPQNSQIRYYLAA